MEYVRLANAIDAARGPGRECLTVWENVEGVLSDNDNAFGCFLGALAGDKYSLIPAPRPDTGKSSRWWRWNKKHESHVPKWAKSGIVHGPQRTVAWRLLDAQYFGVAQRRRRVFVVSSARDRAHPVKILFEYQGVRRDSPPSRETGQEVAGDVAIGIDEEGNARIEGFGPLLRGGQGGTRQAVAVRTAQTSTNGHGIAEEVAHTLDRANGQAVAFDARQSDVIMYGSKTGPLDIDGHTMAVAFEPGIAKRDGGDNRFNTEICPTLRSQMGDNQPAVATELQVRRLTPVECERLQGMPDNHTQIPQYAKPRYKDLEEMAEYCGFDTVQEYLAYGPPGDGPRYKSIGNSKAVPVVKWLGLRIRGVLSD